MRHLVTLAMRAIAMFAAVSSIAVAQTRSLKVVSADGQPIVHAYVTVEGGAGLITDEDGKVGLGSGKRQSFAVTVRRIGFKPWTGKLDLPDTAAVLVVTLEMSAQQLNTIQVLGRGDPVPSLRPFYDRWMMRQKGSLSATFIGPEELQFRHPSKISNVLNGLNGVQLRHVGVDGDIVAFPTTSTSPGGSCPMAIVIDGMQQYMPEGKHVSIDRILNADDVMAIEVYSRGGNMPVSLQVNNSACGVIAFWTGSRQP